MKKFIIIGFLALLFFSASAKACGDFGEFPCPTPSIQCHPVFQPGMGWATVCQ